MSEPTVIERMARTYRQSFHEWLEIAPTDKASEGAMLAAVRELQCAIMERDGRCHRSVAEVISEHERRSKGDG